MNLNVNEIFYSLQGEGGRVGEASVFIRLTQCNLQCDFCDTDFESGEDMTLEEILNTISAFPCKWIIWTGGEPTLQLTDQVLLYFKEKGYKQAVESNGLLPLSDLFDYITCSPKGNPAYVKKINPEVHEIRIPIRKNDSIPSIENFPKAIHYFLSPIFNRDTTITKENISYCVEQIKLNPFWKLSVQMHKLIDIP